MREPSFRMSVLSLLRLHFSGRVLYAQEQPWIEQMKVAEQATREGRDGDAEKLLLSALKQAEAVDKRGDGGCWPVSAPEFCTRTKRGTAEAAERSVAVAEKVSWAENSKLDGVFE